MRGMLSKCHAITHITYSTITPPLIIVHWATLEWIITSIRNTISRSISHIFDIENDVYNIRG